MRKALSIALLLAGCTGDDGVGSVQVTLSGEEASLTGFPVDLGGGERIAFEDGWTAQFTHVLVGLSDFTLATSDGESIAGVEPIVADLHLGMPDAWTIDAVPAQRWDRVSYRIAPPATEARLLAGVDATLVDTMRTNGWSMLIQGTAQNGADTVQFSLGFPLAILNSGCQNADETDGVVVTNGGTSRAELTIHLDHLFFDTYASDEAPLRFEPFAAVADASGLVTLEALGTQELASPVDRMGMPIVDGEGNPVVYDPGPLVLSERNLRGYVKAAATTVGHFNGEGHCDYVLQ